MLEADGAVELGQALDRRRARSDKADPHRRKADRLAVALDADPGQHLSGRRHGVGDADHKASARREFDRVRRGLYVGVVDVVEPDLQVADRRRAQAGDEHLAVGPRRHLLFAPIDHDLRNRFIAGVELAVAVMIDEGLEGDAAFRRRPRPGQAVAPVDGVEQQAELELQADAPGLVLNRIIAGQRQVAKPRLPGGPALEGGGARRTQRLAEAEVDGELLGEVPVGSEREGSQVELGQHRIVERTAQLPLEGGEGGSRQGAQKLFHRRGRRAGRALEIQAAGQQDVGDGP